MKKSLPEEYPGKDFTLCGEGGIRTHGGHEDHNGFRDRPDRPLRHRSGTCEGDYTRLASLLNLKDLVLNRVMHCLIPA